MFRTRQAPSPTGSLHLGTTRQVLFSLLFAKKNQGEWYLRLEDTDQKRLQPKVAKQMLLTLQELNLLPEEGITLLDTTPLRSLNSNQNYDQFYQVWEQGRFRPYIQSKRLDIYHKHAQTLIEKKLAYWSYLNESQKKELQELKKINKKPIDYFKIASESREADKMFQKLEKGLKDTKKPVLRYRIMRDKTIECFDELLGKTSFNLNLEEDFIILKSDGFPTYHLAHLIDDHFMQTSLVIRGQEWYASLAKHVVMFRDYFGKEPKYIHLPVILGETGNKKLSKRDGKADMEEYLQKGYLPEAILNYLAFLGWNPGTDKELYLDPKDF